MRKFVELNPTDVKTISPNQFGWVVDTTDSKLPKFTVNKEQLGRLFVDGVVVLPLEEV